MTLLNIRTNDVDLNITLLNFWKSRRFILSILTFFGHINLFALRANLSVAIVDMTQLKNVTSDNGTVVIIREFEWDSKLQGYILSSFFYGYVATQFLGGYVASKIGGTTVFGFAIGITSALTLVTPFVAKYNVYLLIAVRILEGVFEGATFPAFNTFLGKWAPPLERGRLLTISASGSHFGALIAMPVSSWLATTFGWESIFYVFGCSGLVWYFIWLLYARDTPHKDSRISEQELKYITQAISETKSQGEFRNIPILTYVTSLPVWAICLSLFSENWGFYTMFTCLPTFMKNILNFDLNSAGLLSGAPYLAMAIMLLIAGQLGDLMIIKNILSRTNTRKLFIFVGFLSQAILLLIGTFWMSPSGTSVCLIMALGLGAFALAAMAVVIIDLAPKYGGITGGYCNTFGALPGIISPIVTGYIVTDQKNVYQWRNVFYISAAMYIIGAILYVLFGSSEVQPWGQDDTVSAENGKQIIDHDNLSTK